MEWSDRNNPEAARLLGAIDAPGTVLGPRAAWPPELRTLVGLMLRSKAPQHIVWGPEQILLYNDGYIPVLGDRHPEAFGMRFREVWPEIWADLEPIVRRTYAGEADAFENHPWMLARGDRKEPVWISFAYTPVEDARSEVLGLHCTFHETTSTVLAQRELARATDELSTLALERQLALDAARLGWWQYDPATGRVRHDARYAEIYGLSGPSPRPVEQINDLLHPDDAPRLWEAVTAAMSPLDPQPYAVEYRIRRTDGAVRWLEARGIASFESEGETRSISNFVGTVGDITERRLADDVLRGSEARFRLMADTSPAALWLTDPEGHCTFLSKQWYELTGQQEEEALGLGWTSATHPDDQERAGRVFLEANAERRVFQIEYRLRTRDGDYRWAIDIGRPWYSADGEYAGMVGVVFDIDGRKRAEQALEDASRRKDEFLATLAHELRNPLAPISNALQVWPLLERTPEEAARLREMMGRQVKQMVRLIDDLLDVSRITRGKIELRRERLDLRVVLGAAIGAQRPFLDAHGHALDIDLPADPLAVEADPGRLVQVFGNLLHNAIKYTPAQGWIRIAATHVAGQVQVSIADDGAGIPREMLATIFEMFTQVDQSLGRTHGGLGIGLTLVRNLVELHGGSVEARSEGPGKGSEFIVHLPAVTHMQSAPDASDRVPQLAPLPPRRILVVDDVAASADTFALMLRSLGQVPLAVYDGAAALHAIGHFQPEVAFIDIAMPGLDGYEVARRASAAGTRMPVLVALTGFGQEEDRRRAMAAGFGSHLVKPASLAGVHRLLSELDAAGHAVADAPGPVGAVRSDVG